jgi:hypothetical protein
MPTIEKYYLSPLNPGTAISENDRLKVYSIIREHLSDVLTGGNSYYPDSVQKDAQARSEDLQRFIRSVDSLKGPVNDPSNILGDAVEHLKVFRNAFDKRNEMDDPTDPIDLPPGLSPTRETGTIFTSILFQVPFHHPIL